MVSGPPKPAETAFLSDVKDYLQKTLESQNGVAGFASGGLADAGDTARALMTLEFFGVDVDFVPMIEYFRSGLCFKTSDLERNPSFSANCNVLWWHHEMLRSMLTRSNGLRHTC
ncbi:uncharacterized protein LDX57_006791 [Aspergillus melleus]|uniref:uncharacterized protein n=1 Tax=Aspergillus melleus TaxID=138277 RepID=UPI001E8D1EB5|nr:uncharacterized protein LDX57_006791 [Aspergillus melleus]KAH8429121.1 hypothetical protein LDX57_006791 [Aspergillus melleus]